MGGIGERVVEGRGGGTADGKGEAGGEEVVGDGPLEGEGDFGRDVKDGIVEMAGFVKDLEGTMRGGDAGGGAVEVNEVEGRFFQGVRGGEEVAARVDGGGMAGAVDVFVGLGAKAEGEGGAVGGGLGDGDGAVEEDGGALAEEKCPRGRLAIGAEAKGS